MSKVLIDVSIIKNAIDALDYGAEMGASVMDTMKLSMACDDLWNATLKAQKISVLEWRGFDEKPENGKAILMRWNDGSISTIQPGDFWPSEDDVRAWAYLPE